MRNFTRQKVTGNGFMTFNFSSPRLAIPVAALGPELIKPFRPAPFLEKNQINLANPTPIG
jgi:hypothetical protein